MLSRPPADADAKRQQRRARDRRRYRRRIAGLAIAPVPYGETILNYLIRLHWLAASDANDKVKIGEAISAAVRESAEGSQK
jgi:hypothetical protein